MYVIFGIWFAIFAINIALTVFAVEECKDVFRRKYPELKIIKKHWTVEASAVLRLVLYALIPILNLAMLWTLLANHEELVNRSVHKTYLECMEEQKNAQKACDISDSSET